MKNKLSFMEMLGAAVIVLVIGWICFIAYVAWHFISKYW